MTPWDVLGWMLTVFFGIFLGVFAIGLMRSVREPRPTRCVCGSPRQPGTVHRTDGPCYLRED